MLTEAAAGATGESISVLVGPSKKQKLDIATCDMCNNGCDLKHHRRNTEYLAALEKEVAEIISRKPILKWCSNPKDIVKEHYWSRLKIGSLRCTLNAVRNLFCLPTVTDEVMYEASVLWKHKLLKPLVNRTPYLLSSHCPNLNGRKVKCGIVPLDAALSFMQKFLRPRIEFRRWDQALDSTSIVLKASKGASGGILLPMYILGVHAEPLEERKHHHDAKGNTAIPIGQCHTISVDLREGRNVIFDDTKRRPIPFTDEAFKSLESMQYGIFVTKRVFLYC